MTERACNVCKLCSVLGCYPDCDRVNFAALEDFLELLLPVSQFGRSQRSLTFPACVRACVCAEQNAHPRRVKNNKSIAAIVAEP